MAVLIEDALPVVKHNGLNTDKAVVLGSTLAVTGAITATGGVAGAVAGGVAATTLTSSGVTELKYPRALATVTDLDAQAATPTIAQLLGGIITQNSKTGASTITLPTGTQISTGIPNVAVGYSFDVVYYNRGDQTSTITGATGSTVVGTAAIATTKSAFMRFYNTGANAWSIIVVAAA